MLTMVINNLVDLVKEIWNGIKENRELTKQTLDNGCRLHKGKRDKEGKLLEEGTNTEHIVFEKEFNAD